MQAASPNRAGCSSPRRVLLHPHLFRPLFSFFSCSSHRSTSTSQRSLSIPICNLVCTPPLITTLPENPRRMSTLYPLPRSLDACNPYTVRRRPNFRAIASAITLSFSWVDLVSSVQYSSVRVASTSSSVLSPHTCILLTFPQQFHPRFVDCSLVALQYSFLPYLTIHARTHCCTVHIARYTELEQRYP